MKAIVLLLLVLSTLFVVGCATITTTEVDDAGTQEATPENVASEIDDSLIAEDDEVEIGEMI